VLSDPGYKRRLAIPLKKLQSNTLYHYRLTLKDPVGNVTTTGDLTFSTETLFKFSVNALSTPDSTDQSFITSYSLGTLRNDFTGWVGMQVLVGDSALTVSSLGRMNVAGNTQAHTLTLVRASDGVGVPGSSVNWMASGASGQFSYADLPSPVTLAANTLYYVVTFETEGGDQWYEIDTSVTPSADGSIPTGIYWSNSWIPSGASNHVWGPLDFRYHLATSSLVSAGTSYTLFPPTTTPTVFYPGDQRELGVKFRSDVNGFIDGIRFYKGIADTGVHTGSLWSSTGQLLATGTFTNESAVGWQQLTFDTPVAITANTTYVASYHTFTGFFFEFYYFQFKGVDSGPLHALQDGIDGPNGVYGPGGFPTQWFFAGNCWVDVAFSTSMSGSLTTNQAPAVSAGPDKEITLPSGVFLSGTATDDGLPYGTLTATWSVVSGPGPVTFGTPTVSTNGPTGQPLALNANTTASFTLPGTYVLRLTVTDGQSISTAIASQ
jgi:hypothetical protein